MAGILGNNDDRISDFRKCWIEDGSTGDIICGIYGPGTSKEITANWVQPFVGEGLPGQFGAAARGIAQLITGMTMISNLNTRQTWEGNQPMSFNLEFILYALGDPQSEVMEPLRLLETWIAPNSARIAGPGEPPGCFILNIGTKIIYTDMVINAISQPFDKEVDSKGNFVRATVNIQMSSLTQVSKEILEKGYGLRKAR